MRPSLQTRLDWFTRAARSLEMVHPAIAEEAGVEDDGVYACPLCIERDAATGTQNLVVFPRAAVEARTLTAEHVPPKSFGGKPLVLTCAACNSKAGTELDAHARNRENPVDLLLLGRRIKPRRVRLAVGGKAVEADIAAEGKQINVKVGERRGRRKRELTLREARFQQAMSAALRDQANIHISFIGDRYSDRRARASWLRSGYLAMFALLGYRYILAPALDIVRRQIRDPETEHIAAFLVTLPGDRLWADRGIHMIDDAHGHPCWGVRIGRYVVLLPDAPDTTLYGRLAAASSDTGAVTLTAQSFDWPSKPFFGE